MDMENFPPSQFGSFFWFFCLFGRPVLPQFSTDRYTVESLSRGAYGLLNKKFLGGLAHFLAYKYGCKDDTPGL